jgi:flavin-binding protein dodecin
VAIHKVIEVLSQSDESWEDAAQLAVKDASKTVKGIKSIYISHLQGDVEKGKIVRSEGLIFSRAKKPFSAKLLRADSLTQARSRPDNRLRV